MWFQNSKHGPVRPVARNRTRALRMESLEARQMMHGDALDEITGGPDAMDIATTPVVVDPVVRVNVVPHLSSLPGAPATLFLDFDGNFQSSFAGHHDISTPAFDRDGNTGSLSGTELDAIRQIWASVAEDYAPFNINVTTVDPGDFSNGSHHMRIAIGGQTFTDVSTSGVAQVNSFTNSDPNIAFVFDHKPDGSAFSVRKIGETVSHEAGHTFGLYHQSTYNASGVQVDEFNEGDSLRAPIMGDSDSAERGLWVRGPSQISSNTMLSPNEGQYLIFMGARYILGQDDMARIARSGNGFGYRPDDHSSSLSLATPLIMGDHLLTGHGIIEKTTDRDVFKFQTGGGFIGINVHGAVHNLTMPIGNLDPAVELRSFTGALIASSNVQHSQSEFFTANLPAGTYFVVVTSNGEYGDVGQYTVEAMENSGPRVLSAQRSHVTDTLDAIYVTFNEPIDASIFTAADVYFGAPPYAPTNVSVSPQVGSARQFVITYTRPPVFDVQSVTLGPLIADLFGNWMDEDGDHINGEPEDRFTQSFLPPTDATFAIAGGSSKKSTASGTLKSASLQPAAVDAIFAAHSPRRKK